MRLWWRPCCVAWDTAPEPMVEYIDPGFSRQCCRPGAGDAAGPVDVPLGHSEDPWLGRGISIFKLRLHIFKSKPCHRSSNIAMFIDFDKILLLMLPLLLLLGFQHCSRKTKADGF